MIPNFKLTEMLCRNMQKYCEGMNIHIVLHVLRFCYKHVATTSSDSLLEHILPFSVPSWNFHSTCGSTASFIAVIDVQPLEALPGSCSPASIAWGSEEIYSCGSKDTGLYSALGDESLKDSFQPVLYCKVKRRTVMWNASPVSSLTTTTTTFQV